MKLRILIVAVLACGALAAPSSAGEPFPERIPLPNGWQPEGIATGRGTDFFAGSRAGAFAGAVFAGDLRTGRGEVLVPPQPGRAALGMKVDRRGRLFVAGGPTGKGFVYSTRSGRTLAEYTFITGAPTFVNDVIVTQRAAYFTDSHQQQLYVLDLGRGGRLPAAARTLPLTGDFQIDNDSTTFELNGIAATRDGRRLITVQARTGLLFLVDPRSGDTEQIDLGGATLANGDGILLDGRTLYVVQNRLNQIAVVRLDRGLDDGRVVDTITDPDFDVPTTIARKGRTLWAVNARFTTPPTPETEYDVVKVG
jgi:sugar lactone lactonase YvrE